MIFLKKCIWKIFNGNYKLFIEKIRTETHLSPELKKKDKMDFLCALHP